MVYNLKESLDREQFLTRARFLAAKGDGIVELKEKKQRTIAQNSYCHAIIQFFALQTGVPVAEVKEVYFKATCSPDIFLRTRHDNILGHDRDYLRSTSDITKEEMTLAIDRFLKWASETAGIYIPPSDEYIAVQRMQYEIQRNKRYI